MLKKIFQMLLASAIILNISSAFAAPPSKDEPAADNYFEYDDGKNIMVGTNNFSKHGFFLLGSNDENGEYFILSKRSYQLAPIDDANINSASGTIYKLDPDSSTNLAYKMNTGNLLTSNTMRDTEVTYNAHLKVPTYANFPKTVFDPYVNTHSWDTEASGKVTAPYAFSSKYSVLSKTEFDTYILAGETDSTKKLVRVNDYMKHNELTETASSQRGQVILRTASPQNLYMYGIIMNSGHTSAIAHEWACVFLKDREQQIKPVFYVNTDFFKNVKLNVSTMGRNIKTLILGKCSKKDLKNIYSESELKQIGFPDDYILDTVYLKADGQTLFDSFEPNSTVISKATFSNNTEDPILNPTILSVLYNDDGSMLDASYHSFGVDIYPMSSTPQIDLSIQIPAMQSSKYVLANYFWSNLDDSSAIMRGDLFNSVANSLPSNISEESLYIDFNQSTQIVTISGTDPNMATQIATVTVLYPGKEVSDLDTSDITDVFEYLGQCEVLGDGKYGFSYKVKENASIGKLTVKVTIKDQVHNGIYVYKDVAYEKRVLDEINAATSKESIFDIFDENKSILSVNMDLWDALKDTNYLAAACNAMLDKGEFISLDSATEQFDSEMAVQAVSKANTGDEVKALVFLYNSYLKLDLTRYINSVDEVYVNAIYADLAKMTFTNIGQLTEQYIKAVILSKVNNVTNYSAVKPILLSERSVLEGFGLDMAVYDRLNDSSKFDSVITIDYDSWEDFYEKFQKEAENDDNIVKYKKETTSSGGGSGSSIRISIPVVTDNEPEKKDNENIKENDAIYFSDLQTVPWAIESINGLAKAGYVVGKNEVEFCPNDFITREEFVTILVRAFGFKSEQEPVDFDDVKHGDWYYDSIAAAKKKDITNGIGERSFGVGQKITREEVASLMYRTYKAVTNNDIIITGEPFADEIIFAPYAVNSINAMKSIGILGGKESNLFYAKDYATRAETAKVIHSLLLQVN